MSSSIPQPITANYIFQTLGTLFSSDKKQVGCIQPESPCILSSRNTTFAELQQNSYKYQFIYKYDLDNFIAGATDPVVAGNVVILSHDQIRLNYAIPLVPELTINDILQDAALSSHTPLQDCSGGSGMTAGAYVFSIQQALPTILSQCPVDVSAIADFHPVYYVGDYTFTTICGDPTTKTSTAGIMRYRECSPGRPIKVLLWGTGLIEIPIPAAPST